MRFLSDLVQHVCLQLERAYLRCRLARRGIDLDSIPEIQEFCRRYEAGKPSDSNGQPEMHAARPDERR